MVRVGHFDEVDRPACSPRRCRAGMERLSSRFPPSVVFNAPKPPLGGPGDPVRGRFPGAWGCASLRPVDAGRRPLTRCRVRRFFCLHFPKIPLRRSRTFESTPAADRSVASASGCYTVRMFRPCGFTPLRRFAPRWPCPRCCSGSRPWGSPPFHPRACESSGIPAVCSCPSKRSLRRPPLRRNLRRRRETRAFRAGRIAPPARLSPCSAAPLARALKPGGPDIPKDLQNRHPTRSHAP